LAACKGKQQRLGERATAPGGGPQEWLFVGNDDAGEVNSMFVSLLASCQLHRVTFRTGAGRKLK
jgi:hypothetical protein